MYIAQGFEGGNGPPLRGGTQGGIRAPRRGMARDAIATIDFDRYWKIFNKNQITLALIPICSVSSVQTFTETGSPLLPDKICIASIVNSCVEGYILDILLRS